ncbi:MAG: 4-hydroxythreonine-4-phosphate dehydrogenase PdxA [Rhodobacteraceae bacterium]|nr:4-hydroxythreonine-4-phosphate dehydrogenase PdxA [Paracoccaceae bacterium]
MENLIAITMGDPAGIGPEITAKLVADGKCESCVIFGDPTIMSAAFAKLNISHKLNVITGLADFNKDRINLLQTSEHLGNIEIGEVSEIAGQAAFDAIAKAIDQAMAGKIKAIVTAPIHKESLAAAGYTYPGHTEILAHMSGAKVAMMLVNDDIRTVLVTIHMSLRDAIDAGDFNAQCAAIMHAQQGAREMGIKKPRIAVAGLNPHAGEAGRFGREEIDIIIPAIKACRAKGINASGPWPGDTVFMMARQGKFDVVVAQYHDQGLIPVKYLGLEKGVNITLGLPFVRTSPDHGTAFDIAGQGIADVRSMQAALDMARQLINARE